MPRWSWVIITILVIGLIGTTFWGYKEHEDKNAILIQAENTYQRSFHELTYNMDLLYDKIGTTLAMNSKDSLSPELVEIWRLTSEAMSNVGQLPLTLLPFNKTEEFLSNIGDFTYRTAARDLDKEPLSDDELKTLEGLYEQSEDIKNELRMVQHEVLENNLRWMDVQLALATDEEQEDNTIIDGLKTVEKKVEGYSEGNEDSSLLGTQNQEHEYLNIDKGKINKNEVLKRSAALFEVKNEDNINITKSGDGADLPLFNISYEDENKNVHLDMSQHGGHPISMLVNRTVDGQKLSLHEGQKKADKYLKDQKFENMSLYRSNQYDSVGVYSFLYEEDSIRMYPDAIEVKVALDNGEIIGLTARNYFMNHEKRDLPEPKITKKDAKKKVNPSVDIQEEFVAVIDNDSKEEVLTYEFIGTMGSNTYRIFINAMDGTEERIEKLKKTEINFASIK